MFLNLHVAELAQRLSACTFRVPRELKPAHKTGVQKGVTSPALTRLTTVVRARRDLPVFMVTGTGVQEESASMVPVRQGI